MLGALSALTNNGSMPINAGGGSAAPSAARSKNSVGGIGQSNINMGGGTSTTLILVGVGVMVAAWFVLKK